MEYWLQQCTEGCCPESEDEMKYEYSYVFAQLARYCALFPNDWMIKDIAKQIYMKGLNHTEEEFKESMRYNHGSKVRQEILDHFDVKYTERIKKQQKDFIHSLKFQNRLDCVLNSLNIKTKMSFRSKRKSRKRSGRRSRSR